MHDPERQTKIDHQIRTQVDRLKRLREDTDGPIAQHYADLQGLPFLQIATETHKDDLSQELSLCYRLVQSIQLIDFTASDLASRATALLLDSRELSASSLQELSGIIAWLADLIELKYSIVQAGTCFLDVFFGSDKDNDPGTRSRLPHEISEFHGLEGLYAALLRRHETDNLAFLSALEYGYICDPYARIIHDAKNILHLQERAHALAHHIMARIPNFHEFYVQRRALQYAALGLRLRRKSTYFSQFRLLHQIPEILGEWCVKEIKQIDLDDVCSAASRLWRMSKAMSIITECLHPLRDLMYPSEYYKIRKNLGVTSGSDSVVLSRHLLRKSFAEFSRNYYYFISRHPSRRTELLRANYAEVRITIDKWRDLHTALPRNVLGSDGTRSLIGANDAVAAVKAMKRSFDRSIPPHPDAEVGLEDKKTESASIETRLDDALLQATGQITKARFPDVQNRQGIFSRTPHNEEISTQPNSRGSEEE